jgi:hypothetical protein
LPPHYRNAEELNAFQRKIEMLSAFVPSNAAGDMAEVDCLREEYEGIKRSCPYNHEPVDHRLFLAINRSSADLANETMSFLSALLAEFHGAVSGLLYL